MGLSFPLVAWGAAEDISAAPWVSQGTPIVTGGQGDPFGGTGAVLIEDDDAAFGENRNAVFGTVNATFTLMAVFLKAATAATTEYLLYDVMVGTGRGRIRATWSGGVPTVTFVPGNGTATVIGVVSVGGGWYLILSLHTGLTAGNTHRRYLYPAGSSAVNTGSAYFYLRNAVLLDALQGPPRVWDSIRPGSTKVVGPDGGYDSWITGRYYRLAGRASCIPSRPRSSPLVVSGWEGENEAVGINCGVQAMLRAGQNAQTLTFVPDRSDCATNIASELVKPFEDEEGPVTLLNGDREFDLELRNTTTPYPSPL